jgi:hypothetical protein
MIANDSGGVAGGQFNPPRLQYRRSEGQRPLPACISCPRWPSLPKLGIISNHGITGYRRNQ